MQKSELLTQQAFEVISQGANVLEQDERGVKVLMLADGDILKIFRIRNKCSAAHLFSYARRFCRNAERLMKIGIPTVEVKRLYHLNTRGESAVLYTPLGGQTLREVIKSRSLSDQEARNLGKFIAKLHHSGVHFRSLHLGNIVLDDRSEFGLIDIADMSIYAWPLWCSTRARSFTHFHRYPEQIQALGIETWQAIRAGYFDAAKLKTRCAAYLQQHIEKVSVFS